MKEIESHLDDTERKEGGKRDDQTVLALIATLRADTTTPCN